MVTERKERLRFLLWLKRDFRVHQLNYTEVQVAQKVPLAFYSEWLLFLSS